MKKYLTFLFLILASGLNAQESRENDFITNSLSSYMQDRNAIHLHLNKDSYFTGESIWFTAYLFDISGGSISKQDANLHVVLYDENGLELSKKLLVTQNGIAQGEFLIGPRQKGSALHLKAYTAIMNSYPEDNSFTTTVALLSADADIAESSSPALDIKILPEGGYPLANVTNNYGIKILNESGLGVALEHIQLVDAQGNVLLNELQTNAFGMGKFVFMPSLSSDYKLRILYKDSLIEKQLPKALRRGVGMRVDQNFVSGGLETRIYTNEQSLPFIQNDSLILVVHKGAESRSYYVKFEKGYNELKLSLPKSRLYAGVNTITLFNSAKEPLLERLIFNTDRIQTNSNSEVISTREGDSTSIQVQLATTDKALRSLSVSVLPAASEVTQQIPNIYASSHILPFIKGHLEQANYYFTDPNAQKWYALDLVLLNQGWSKYKWSNIFKNRINTSYYFNGPGITLKGYLRTQSDSKPTQLLFYSKENKQVQYIPVNEQGEFVIDNIIATVGTTFELAAINASGTPVECQFFYTVSPTRLDLDNPFALDTTNPFSKYSSDSGGYYFGFDPEAERLKEVVVTAKKLKYEQYFGGWDARIIDNSEKSRGNLGNFMSTYGYSRKADGSRARLTTDLQGNIIEVYPGVVVDGLSYPVSFIADALNMQDVAEIYVKRGERTMNNPLGSRRHMFVVFTENGLSFSGEDNSTAKSFTLTNKGISPAKEFYQPLYDYKSDSFKALGTYAWFAEITPDANNRITVDFYNPENDDCLLIIQGIDNEGYPYSNSIRINTTDK
ncbi:hypothetical protein [Gilvibacter sp.]|uniref:hypothetical protein n=1 Tax=Gilvibacter sp. TaxID=2729997 RepID=UPI003B522B9F